MVPRWRIFLDFWVLHFQRPLRLGEEKRKKKEEERKKPQGKNIMAFPIP